jgi:hypothetical protein
MSSVGVVRIANWSGKGAGGSLSHERYLINNGNEVTTTPWKSA